jgi:hypothetical protein
MVPVVNPQKLKRWSRIKIKLRALRKTSKLMRMLKEPRSEGVEFNALKLMFSNDILAHPRLHTFLSSGMNFVPISFKH